jgi:anti-sigma B factor antagonist
MLHHKKLDIRHREREGIVILDLKGHLVMGAGDITLRDCVESLSDPASRQLVLDFAQISEIDTSGMEVLLLLAQQYRNAGGKLVLFNIAHTHGKVYEMARLETVVEIYRDELDAINSFFPDRKVNRYDILDYVESHVPHEDQNNKT